MPIDHYVVEKFDPENGVWIPCGKTDDSAPEFDVKDLIPGHEYKFRVKAVNSEGESEPLETIGHIVAKDPFTVPSQPGQPSPVDWSENHVELEWAEPASDGGSEILHYVIEKKDQYSPMWEKAQETHSKKTKCTVGGLVEGNVYQFRVIAVNKAGPSEASDPSKNHTAKPRYLPPRIDRKNLRETTISAGTLLKFDVNISGEPAPKVDWRFNQGPLSSGRRVEITNVDYNTKLTVRPVNRDDSGEYEVIAVNSSGRDQATVTVIVTDKPSAPKGPLEISDIHKDGCKLKWKRPVDDGGTPIEYFQAEKMDTETGVWVPCGRSTEPHLDVTGLTPGAEYQFRVYAVNAEGESPSLVADEKIIAKNPFDEPGKPANVRCTDSTKDSVSLAWSEPTSDGGSPITGYIIEKKPQFGQSWQKAAEVFGPVTSGTVPDLVEGETYEFR